MSHMSTYMYVWQVQGYPLYHLVKAQTEKQTGAKEDALASLQTAMSFITSKKPGMNTQACTVEENTVCVLHVHVIYLLICGTCLWGLPV